MRRGIKTTSALAASAVVALALLAFAAPASGAVVVPGTFVTSEHPDDSGTRCHAVLFYIWPHIPGAIGYVLHTEDTITGTADTFVEPNHDAGPGDGFPPIGRNQQRVGLTSIDRGNPCPGDMNGGRFTARVTAIFCDSDLKRRRAEDCDTRIVGTVLNSDGSGSGGVPISAHGPENKSTHTNSGGGYAINLRHSGVYTVTAPHGFCAVEEHGCERSIQLNVPRNGIEGVNFVARDLFSVTGTVTDEFGRGLNGVQMRLTGPETESAFSDADGKYRLEVDEPGTYELTATGQNRGPYELYYIRLADGQSSGGQAADVPFGGTADPSHEINWILDNRMQYRLETVPVSADGLGNYDLNLRVLTQHADPAPGVQLSIDPDTSGRPYAVMCNVNGALASRPLWPTLADDGSFLPLGLPPGPETTTDDSGTIPLELFPGTEGGSFAFSGNRQGDTSSVFFTEIQFDPTQGSLDEAQLQQGLRAASPNGNFGSEQVLIDLIAAARGIDDPLARADVVPVTAGGRRGLAFFPLGAPIGNPASGAIGAVDNAWVWDDSLLLALPGVGDLPSLAEWAAGDQITAVRADRRTFLGYPLATSLDDGVGNCLAGAPGDTMTFAAHSPAHLALTDGQGRKIGFNAKGKQLSDGAGAAVRRNGDDYVIVPAGDYRLTVAGTGKGPVTLEARSGNGVRIAQLRAQKGATATLKVSATSLLPKKFRFAGQRVKSVAGIPLAVKGLPRKLRSGKKAKIRLVVKDALGEPVTFPTLTISGAAEQVVYGDAAGRIRTTLQAPKKGKVTLTVSANSRLDVRKRLKVRR